MADARNGDRKGRAFAVLALHANVTIVAFDQAAANVQAQAGAANFAGVGIVDTVELLE